MRDQKAKTTEGRDGQPTYVSAEHRQSCGRMRQDTKRASNWDFAASKEGLTAGSRVQLPNMPPRVFMFIGAISFPQLANLD